MMAPMEQNSQQIQSAEQTIQQAQQLQTQQQQSQQQTIEGQPGHDTQQPTYMQINNWDPNRTQVQLIPTGISNGFVQYASQSPVMMPNIATFQSPNGQILLSSPTGAKQFQANQLSTNQSTVFITQGNNKYLPTSTQFQGFSQIPMSSNGGQTFVLGSNMNLMSAPTQNAISTLNQQQDAQKDISQPVIQSWPVQSIPQQQIWPQSSQTMLAPNSLYVNRGQQNEMFATSGIMQNNTNLITQTVSAQNAIKRPLEQPNSNPRASTPRSILPNQGVRVNGVVSSPQTQIPGIFVVRGPTAQQSGKVRPSKSASFVSRNSTSQPVTSLAATQLVSQPSSTIQLPQHNIVNQQPMVSAVPQSSIHQVMIRNVQLQQHQYPQIPTMISDSLNPTPTISIPQSSTITMSQPSAITQSPAISIPQQQIIASPGMLTNNTVAQVPLSTPQIQPISTLISQNSQPNDVPKQINQQQSLNLPAQLPTATSTEDKTATKALAMVKPNQMVTQHIINGRTIREDINLDNQETASATTNNVETTKQLAAAENNSSPEKNKSPCKKRLKISEDENEPLLNGNLKNFNMNGDVSKNVDNTPKIDPTNWTIKEVSNYIKTLPNGADLAEDFENQEIDGTALFMLEADHLMTAMEMKLGPALKIIEHIKAMRDEVQSNIQNNES